MQHKHIILTALLSVAAASLAAAFVSDAYQKNTMNEIAGTLDSLQQPITTNQVAVGGRVPVAAPRADSVSNSPATSQEQLVTSVIAATTPAVVSIVISEEVPQYQVDYVNPFGGDPNMQDFGLQLPVYQQTGTSSLQKVGAGSGFLVSHDGYIVTNKHVIFDPKAQYTVILSDGSKKSARVAYTDPVYDLALLKVGGTYDTIAPLGDSGSVALGQTIITIGNALGVYDNSVSVGIISGLNRSIDAGDPLTGGSEKIDGAIQIDAAVNPGNSGGPLLDLGGNVIGINVATAANSNNISFAIPINMLKAIIRKYAR